MQQLQIPVSISIEKNVLAATAPRATDTSTMRLTRAACRSEWEFVLRVRRHALQLLAQRFQADAAALRPESLCSETIEAVDNGWLTARTTVGGLVRTVKFRIDTDARIDVTQQSPDGHYEAWHVDGATLTVTSGDDFRSLRSVTYVVTGKEAVERVSPSDQGSSFVAPVFPRRSSR